jgi:hypothetical protein
MIPVVYVSVIVAEIGGMQSQKAETRDWYQSRAERCSVTYINVPNVYSDLWWDEWTEQLEQWQSIWFVFTKYGWSQLSILILFL